MLRCARGFDELPGWATDRTLAESGATTSVAAAR
jgi:hypothetical protein